MNAKDQKRYDGLYEEHCNCLMLQGKARSTIAGYTLALRRFTTFLDRSPDTATKADFQRYFKNLLKTHSWSAVKIDRVGLQFFYSHVLEKEWEWIKIVKPPSIQTIPNVLTELETKLLLSRFTKMRYRIFFSCILHGTSHQRGTSSKSW